MISLLIYIKHRFSWLWSIVEWLNGWLFRLRYPNFEYYVIDALSCYKNNEFYFEIVEEGDISALSQFFNSQNPERLEHFNPHKFDVDTLERLYRNFSFTMMKISRHADRKIVGYFFLRCFFIGKAFYGMIVDDSCCGRGLGTTIWKLSTQICSRANIRMFVTVSVHNISSLTSARKATEVIVVDKLANDYLLIECRPKAK